MSMNCFDGDLDPRLLDRTGFLFHHKLLEHPSLSLDSLARVIPSLPAEQVFHSSGLLGNADNFDTAHMEHKPALGLQAAMDQLLTTDAYIMVRQPESDPGFRDLLANLQEDVARVFESAGLGGGIEDAMLYLFIASPNSITPFHIDRYSTFLMQFRGSKEVTIYPPWDQRVVDDQDAEGFFARSGRRPVWRPESEHLGQRFSFSPGEALHIPFAAGHHVRNGQDDVSISLSIIFNTAKTRQLMRALAFNHRMRPHLARIGMTPNRVAPGHGGLGLKSHVWRAAGRAARMFK